MKRHANGLPPPRPPCGFAAAGFAAVDGGTEVTYHLEAELKVPIPGFVKTRAQGRIQTTALRELKSRVESLG